MRVANLFESLYFVACQLKYKNLGKTKRDVKSFGVFFTFETSSNGAHKISFRSSTPFILVYEKEMSL